MISDRMFSVNSQQEEFKALRVLNPQKKKPIFCAYLSFWMDFANVLQTLVYPCLTHVTQQQKIILGVVPPPGKTKAEILSMLKHDCGKHLENATVQCCVGISVSCF